MKGKSAIFLYHIVHIAHIATHRVFAIALFLFLFLALALAPALAPAPAPALALSFSLTFAPIMTQEKLQDMRSRIAGIRRFL